MSDTTPRHYQDYTNDSRAETLAILTDCEGNIAECSRRTGVPEQTIRAWRDARFICTPTPESVETKRRALADLYEDMAYKCLEAAGAEGKAEDASILQLMTASGIATDKMRLLRGEPTGINETRTSEEQKADLETELADRGLRVERTG